MFNPTKGNMKTVWIFFFQPELFGICGNIEGYNVSSSWLRATDDALTAINQYYPQFKKSGYPFTASASSYNPHFSSFVLALCRDF